MTFTIYATGARWIRTPSSVQHSRLSNRVKKRKPNLQNDCRPKKTVDAPNLLCCRKRRRSGFYGSPAGVLTIRGNKTTWWRYLNTETGHFRGKSQLTLKGNERSLAREKTRTGRRCQLLTNLRLDDRQKIKSWTKIESRITQKPKQEQTGHFKNGS